jgi:hypothetical protein
MANYLRIKCKYEILRNNKINNIMIFIIISILFLLFDILYYVL